MKSLLLCFLLLVAAAPAAGAPIRISYSALAPIMVGLWVADDIGAFKKQGLDTQLIYIPASATDLQALIAGSLEIATPGSSGAVIRRSTQKGSSPLLSLL